MAPDHPRIKGIITALHKVLDRGDIRFFGNVEYGKDLTLADLREHYDAIIFATGAIFDAALNIEGIDLDGSYGAADFVSWYDGHPDYPAPGRSKLSRLRCSVTATSPWTSPASSPSTLTTCSSPKSPITSTRA